MATKIIQGIINTHHTKSAGQRVNGVDETTCFGIPGSGLPRRHCNVDINLTTAVSSDMDVYVSINSGKFFQNVFGRVYNCRMYACPHEFRLHIPIGAKGWDDAQFYRGSTQCNEDVFCLLMGNVIKAYHRDNPFVWEFGPKLELTEETPYEESFITQSVPFKKSQSGGEGQSDSKYTYVGKLTDLNWVEEMQSGENGHIFLCGGILYGTSTITSDIDANAVEIPIQGLNTYYYYYPGEVTIDGAQKSLNSPGHCFQIRTTDNSKFPHLKVYGNWRDCKNSPRDGDDAKTTVFRQDGGWKKAIQSGQET